LAADQALGNLTPTCLGVAGEKARHSVNPDAHCRSGLVADLFE
jgi:hypothetical protein